MSEVIDFPDGNGGEQDPLHPPEPTPYRKVRNLLSDMEDHVLHIRTATWLLVNLDHLPEGDELRELRAWLEWLLFDYAADLHKAYGEIHAAFRELGE